MFKYLRYVLFILLILTYNISANQIKKDYLEVSGLENLIAQAPPTIDVNVSLTNWNEYYENIKATQKNFCDSKIGITKTYDPETKNKEQEIFTVMTNKLGYFYLNLINGPSIVKLVIRNSNLYIEGFVTQLRDPHYYGFDDAKIKSVQFAGKTLQLNTLGYKGDYPSLIGQDTTSISRDSLIKSLGEIQNFTGNNPEKLKIPFINLIYITGEAMKFFSVADKVVLILKENKPVDFKTERNNLLVKWRTYSNEFYARDPNLNAFNNISKLLEKQVLLK